MFSLAERISSAQREWGAVPVSGSRTSVSRRITRRALSFAASEPDSLSLSAGLIFEHSLGDRAVSFWLMGSLMRGALYSCCRELNLEAPKASA